MTLLAARGIGVGYDGRAALEAVDFAVDAGEFVALIGPNGAGKTTFLRVLAGLRAPETGAVLFEDAPLAAADRRRLARSVAYLPQNAPVHWPLTVRRLAALGRLPWLDAWRPAGAEDARAIDAALARTDMAAFEDRPVTTLSGGERLRALLARALAGAPRVLLADEPVAALDPFHQLQVMEILRDIARGGGAAVAVLHDLTLAARFCDRLVLLAGGRLVAEGRADRVLSPENLARAYRIEALAGAVEGEPWLVPWRRLEGPEAGP